MPAPPIDILLAVYNGEIFLPALLDSLLAQTFRDFRLVISDNASTDRTIGVIERYRLLFGGRMASLPRPERTVTAVQNFARVTEAAEAPYAMYCDADDVWHADKIAKTIDAMKHAERRSGEHTPILVHSDLAVVDMHLRLLDGSYWRYQFIDPRRVALHQLLVQNVITGCTVMVNRAMLDIARPIPPEAVVHDHWLALVASAFGRIEVIDEPLINYRQHGQNVTGALRWGGKAIRLKLAAFFRDDGLRHSLRRDQEQARVFLSRYGARLSRRPYNDVAAYATIGTQSWMTRRWRLVRHRLWKHGFLRSAGMFLRI